MQRVAQLFGQLPTDHLECFAFIMAFEVLDVFQQKRCRAVVQQNTQHIEEQRPLRFVQKAMSAAKRILLGDPCNGERLAGESCYQNIMFRNIGLVHSTDVTSDRPIIGVIGVVGCLRKAIPFRGKYTSAASLLHSPSEATNTGEQIDEGEIRVMVGWSPDLGPHPKQVHDALAGHFLATFPAIDMPF